jgi:hypothetical protein
MRLPHLAHGIDLPGSGMPQERLAQIAARRAFVEMKQRFMAAVDPLPGADGAWLRERVRRTQQPIELWNLRDAVFATLPMSLPDSRRMRLELHSVLDTAFPDSGDLTAPMGLQEH